MDGSSVALVVGRPSGWVDLRPSDAGYVDARNLLTYLVRDARTLVGRPAAEIAAHVTAQVLPKRLPVEAVLVVGADVLNLAALAGAAVAVHVTKGWCACDCAAAFNVEESALAAYRRHVATGRDRALAAIMLTSQVVPSLLAPELLLLAVDEVTRRWRAYLDRWGETVPAADRPAAAPMRLVEFVDRYCIEVEHGTGPDGCTGRCAASRAGRGCDPDACAAQAWLAHITALARRAEPSHPAHAVLASDAGDGRVPRDDRQNGA